MAKDETTDVVTEDVVEEQVVDDVPQLDDFIDVKGDLIENASIEEEEEDDDAAVDTPVDEDAPEGDVADKTIPTPVRAAEAPAVDEPTVVTPEPVIPKDPGEFVPKLDYSFTLTTTDGKTVTLKTPAEIDAFSARLDSEEGLISASQLVAFTRGVARMDTGLATEQAQYQADKATYDEQQAVEQARTDQLNQWSKELTYLRGKGLVPTPSKTADADWKAHAEEPGIKEAQAIFTWMDTENKARSEAGIAPITSAVDAFRLMQAEQVEETQVSEKTRAGDTRRAKGKMVTGPSSHIPTNAPANAIIGTGGNLNDLLYEYQNDM